MTHCRHRFTRYGRPAPRCTQCGDKNPNFARRTAQRVLILVRPRQRPVWWPENGAGTAAWATVRYDSDSGVGGYTVGRDRTLAISSAHVHDVKAQWNEEHEGEAWEFRVETDPS